MRMTQKVRVVARNEVMRERLMRKNPHADTFEFFVTPRISMSRNWKKRKILK